MVAGLTQMQSDELDFEYIILKSEYEHKKNILTWLMMVIALAVLMNVWNNFWDFMKEVFQYAASMECNGVEIAKISFIISVIITVSIFYVVLLILINYMKYLKMIRQKLMIIEEVKNQQINGQIS